MKFKSIISAVLYFLILSFIGMTFSAFASPEPITIPADFTGIMKFFEDNWALIGLILSEIAAILPGKPKGIIQTVIRIGGKLFGSDSFKRKIKKS